MHLLGVVMTRSILICLNEMVSKDDWIKFLCRRTDHINIFSFFLSIETNIINNT